MTSAFPFPRSVVRVAPTGGGGGWSRPIRIRGLAAAALLAMGACGADETAVRLVLRGQCLDLGRVEMLTVTTEADGGSVVTSHVLYRTPRNPTQHPHRFADGFTIRLRATAGEASPAVLSVTVAAQNHLGIELGRATAQIQPGAGSVVSEPLAIPCGCTGHRLCGEVSGEACAPTGGACGPCPSAEPVEPEACDDDRDNDCDGRVDCRDEECLEASRCEGVCTAEEPAAGSCLDGEDNDCDGAVDCIDEACSQAEPCQGFCRQSETGCFDGLDDDCDGLIDCADPSCSGLPDCCLDDSRAEICGDGFDNDCNGLADCCDADACVDTQSCRGWSFRCRE